MKGQKFIHCLFLLLLCLVLLAGLIRTVFSPKDMNYYENRYAYKIESPSAEGVLSGSFQSSVEDALSDQVFLAQTAKSSFNYANSSFQISLIRSLLEANPNRYVSVLGAMCFGGEYLVLEPMDPDALLAESEPQLDAICALAERYPDLPFYCYYIERDADTDFITGSRTLLSDRIAEKLSLPGGHFGRFSIQDFQEYRTNFYRTDHHWNYLGSYAAYRQLLEMLKPGETPLEPVETVTVSGEYSGSRSLTAGAVKVFTEEFQAYRFDFPPMFITLNREPAADYGNQDAYLNGTAADPVNYGRFYGPDAGEAIFDSRTPGAGSILIFGESYDNAILKLLASHYDKVYAIDLRYYETLMGEPFRFADYVKEHPVDAVLFIGSNAFFRSEEFLLEG